VKIVPDYLFDSGIPILHLRNQSGYSTMTDRLAEEADVYVSVMTRFEVVRGMRERERESTFNLLNSFEALDVTSEIADQAGELIRSWRKRGVTLGDADAIIAATALQHGLVLVTTNAKHFPMPELVIFQADEQGNLSPYKAT
jgi:predicted nucleic acid-binding protein